ncbi:helix-turn-helix transcriptional regulator [Longispora fulva]|uniref:Transcriptional regulator with XRE-family HTH domain n=1 Tax=Longispora fulva TaxID=619741 RepID=A0A8J7GGI6_9ACTN|nr:helix-turn-helix transcriptional regulator [Longispora fulva]MBG6135653.1 transcriptional regulator with XRE-family HTH domain [Longispora fulva]
MIIEAACRREQLRDFLRSRRARLTPADVGLVTAGRRRTPGLRREEVALLAGVGVSWYTWLEQGRDITVSAEVLDAVARALRLDQPERAHLYLVAGLNPPPVSGDPGTVITPEVLALLDAWAPRPAVLRDRCWNVLAYNDTARDVFGFDGTPRNCLVTFFAHPWYRAMPAPWSAAAPAVVAAYRADAVHAPGCQRVVDDLSEVAPEFAELWRRHDVGVPGPAVHALLHPDLGELHFDATTLTVAHHLDWQLVLYNPRTPQPGGVAPTLTTHCMPQARVDTLES